MDALWYSAARQFSVRNVQIPDPGDEEILVKVSLCGMCGTDAHIHEGEFISRFPLIPGHEVVGKIAKLGKNVTDFQVGERVVSDASITCGNCFYCRRGNELMCENYNGLGTSTHGAFAEYAVIGRKKAYRINNISDEAATLIEPAACAVHGVDRLALRSGSEVLIIGSGPTGLLMAQLIKLSGAMRLVVAAPPGPKLDVAKSLDVADEYIELDRDRVQEQWVEIKQAHPYGFDAVIEATGNEAVVNESINLVRRGGTLMVYGVYAHKNLVHWSPERIFREEITIIGSFAQMYCFPRAVEFLETGRVKTDGMVTQVFDLSDYQKALDTMASRKCVKIAIRPTSGRGLPLDSA